MTIGQEDAQPAGTERSKRDSGTDHFTRPAVSKQVGVFVAAVFEPNDLVEVRMLPAKGSNGLRARQEWHLASELTGKADRFPMSNANRLNIYVGANPRRRRGGSRDDVALARTLFVDLDEGVNVDAARQRVSDAGLPVPTMTVDSGHGVHLWWRLDEPLQDLEEWTARQKGLIRAVGGDPVVHDPPRIMRLPGFRNCKPPPAWTSIAEADPTRVYPLEVFPMAVRAAPATAPSERSEERSANSANTLTSLTSLMGDPRVLNAIRLTQPTGPDQRRSKVFKFARLLKAICPDRDPVQLCDVLLEWHRRARPKVHHKDFDNTFADFCDGWGRVKYPGNTGPLADLLERSRSKPVLRCVADCPTESPKLLAGLCRELQLEAGDESFWIDERSAAQVLCLNQSTVNFWFRWLRDRGILHRVEKGRPGRASRYRYLASANDTFNAPGGSA